MRWHLFTCTSILAASAVVAAPTSPRFYGLAAGSVNGFTTSPAGCAISIIFDHAVVGWNNGGADPKRLPELSFKPVGNVASYGRVVKLDVRGNLTGKGVAKLKLTFGGRKSEVAVPPGDFDLHLIDRMSKDPDGTMSTLVLDLAKPADGTATVLSVDSADLSLSGCSTKGTPAT